MRWSIVCILEIWIHESLVREDALICIHPKEYLESNISVVYMFERLIVFEEGELQSSCMKICHNSNLFFFDCYCWEGENIKSREEWETLQLFTKIQGSTTSMKERERKLLSLHNEIYFP